MAASMRAQMELMEKLNRCLDRFQGKKVQDITEEYSYYPTLSQSKLGEGSYGAAYRMKSVKSVNEPVRVVKVVPKDRITRHLLQIHHLCAELAVTQLLHHPRLNRRVGLFHNSTSIFMVLELVEGKQPDLATRLYHIFAHHAKNRIPDVPELVAACPEGGEELLVANELRNLGLLKEDPLAGDLFNMIVHYKRIPAKKALVILKQILEGLEYMHLNSVVHRDMKTENLVLGEDRKAIPLYDSSKQVIGVRIEEKVTCRIIDFGLVKYLKLGQFPFSPSPSVFQTATASDPFADAPALSDVPLVEAPPLNAAIPVTPCGTELYCSLEVIQGIISGGCGRSKWESTQATLPKFDVYGAGTMMYCMCNGRPPFRFTSYRQVTREEKLRQMSNMIAAGPQFSVGCPDTVRPLIRSLMGNNLSARPTAAEALRDPLFEGITMTYAYEVMADGTVRELDTLPESTADDAAPADCSATTTATPSSAAADSLVDTPDTPAVASDDAEDLRLAMAVIRGAEDNGDAADKLDDDGEASRTYPPAPNGSQITS